MQEVAQMAVTLRDHMPSTPGTNDYLMHFIFSTSDMPLDPVICHFSSQRIRATSHCLMYVLSAPPPNTVGILDSKDGHVIPVV